MVHSVLPDHWVPLAVVARTQRWPIGRLTRVSLLAALGHVLTSIAIGGVVALVGLQFQKQIESRQSEIVGGVLIVTGLVFLVWGVTGRGHPHEHGHDHEREHRHASDDTAGREPTRQDLDDDAHRHRHSSGIEPAPSGDHVHEHAHGGVRHTHRHHHEAFIRARAELITKHSSRGTLAGQVAAIAVPFGAAASPDLTFLPIAISASALGPVVVAAVLGVFSVVTIATFVGLTVVATVVGYEMRGEWLERNANTVTAIVLIVIGALVFVGI